MHSAFRIPHSAFPLRLYLTGFMGSGKSTVARALAARTGWTALDLDQLVAARAGRSLAALFAEGEAAFRAVEREALEETFGAHRVVVATGGGALVAPGALEAARRAGRVVYLRLPADVLAARLEGDATPRPLLQGSDGQPLRGAPLHARVAALLAERAPRYAQADAIVDVDGLSPAEVAKAVLDALSA